MPEWLWVIALFVGMTVSYWAGVALGSAKSDRAPSGLYWESVRKYSVDAKKEVELQALQFDHEETMALIARGAMDGVELDAPNDDSENEKENRQ